MKVGLQISAQLENVEYLKAVGDDFRWYMKLSCTSCGEETPEFVYCSQEENSPLAGGRGDASLVLKCKLCKRENSLAGLPGEGVKDFLRNPVYPCEEHSCMRFGSGSCRVGYLRDIIQGSVAPYTSEQSGQFATIVAFDVRGVSPTDFSPRVGWEVKGQDSSTVFSDVDLKDLEWFDYDEKAGQSVSITEFKYRFATVKI